MLNMTNILARVSPSDPVARAKEAHSLASLALKAACAAVREYGEGPEAESLSAEMDAAFAAFEVACDDLREIRDGYRYTYPHPAALAGHGRRYPVR